MADITLEDLGQYGDYAVNNRWRIKFIGLTGEAANFDEERLNTQIQSVTPPSLTFGTPLTVTIHTHDYQQPQIPTPATTMSLTFVETADAYIKRFDKALESLIYEGWRNNRLYPLRDSKFEVIIEMYDRSGQDLMWNWKVYRAFRSGGGIAPSLVSSKNASAVTYNIQIAFNGFDEGANNSAFLS